VPKASTTKKVEAPARAPRTYGVKLVRGPIVRLAPHPDHCADEVALDTYVQAVRKADPTVRLGVDLFSGAGGLGLGLERAGVKVVLGVDHDTEAMETHGHHFGGMSVDWDLSSPDNIDRVVDVMTRHGIDVLAGGPPCQPFSKAGRSLIRHMVQNGLRDQHDVRRDLWRSYLEVVRRARPAAVVMENVPDMALDREMFILRTIVEELECIGYAVEARVLDTYRHAVPQFRQRLILVALRDGVAFEWPGENPERVTVWNAIGDLPEVEGGWRPPGGADGWIEYPGAVTGFQRRMRSEVADDDASKVFDHITRPVREDDLAAFDHLDAGTRYSELPAELKRYREDIFDDKYKRLDENSFSRTITAHIARDGYWYIHPRQHRTITVREAARLQTFPDHFRFAGPPSSAFRQIGNAVPPAFAGEIASAVVKSLDAAQPARDQARAVAEVLSRWFAERPPAGLPWLTAQTRWGALVGEVLLDRCSPGQVSQIWPLAVQWDSPATTLASAEIVTEVASWVSREDRAAQLLELARHFSAEPLAVAQLTEARPKGLAESTGDVVLLAVPGDGEDNEEPVLITKGVLRTAARYSGHHLEQRNRLTDGRMGIARMIGGGASARSAHKALLEIAATICRPTKPDCPACPLRTACVSHASGDYAVEAG
jgi:DNA (cytosine-5)-methyltransferase 1